MVTFIRDSRSLRGRRDRNCLAESDIGAVADVSLSRSRYSSCQASRAAVALTAWLPLGVIPAVPAAAIGETCSPYKSRPTVHQECHRRNTGGARRRRCVVVTISGNGRVGGGGGGDGKRLAGCRPSEAPARASVTAP